MWVFGKVLGGVWESRGNFELLLVGRDLAVGRSSRYGRSRFGRCPVGSEGCIGVAVGWEAGAGAEVGCGGFCERLID